MIRRHRSGGDHSACREQITALERQVAELSAENARLHVALADAGVRVWFQAGIARRASQERDEARRHLRLVAARTEVIPGVER